MLGTIGALQTKILALYLQTRAQRLGWGGAVLSCNCLDGSKGRANDWKYIVGENLVTSPRLSSHCILLHCIELQSQRYIGWYPVASSLPRCSVVSAELGQVGWQQTDALTPRLRQGRGDWPRREEEGGGREEEGRAGQR